MLWAIVAHLVYYKDGAFHVTADFAGKILSISMVYAYELPRIWLVGDEQIEGRGGRGYGIQQARGLQGARLLGRLGDGGRAAGHGAGGVGHEGVVDGFREAADHLEPPFSERLARVL